MRRGAPLVDGTARDGRDHSRALPGPQGAGGSRLGNCRPGRPDCQPSRNIHTLRWVGSFVWERLTSHPNFCLQSEPGWSIQELSHAKRRSPPICWMPSGVPLYAMLPGCTMWDMPLKRLHPGSIRSTELGGCGLMGGDLKFAASSRGTRVHAPTRIYATS